MVLLPHWAGASWTGQSHDENLDQKGWVLSRSFATNPRHSRASVTFFVKWDENATTNLILWCGITNVWEMSQTLNQELSRHLFIWSLIHLSQATEHRPYFTEEEKSLQCGGLAQAHHHPSNRRWNQPSTQHPTSLREPCGSWALVEDTTLREPNSTHQTIPSSQLEVLECSKVLQGTNNWYFLIWRTTTLSPRVFPDTEKIAFPVEPHGWLPTGPHFPSGPQGGPVLEGAERWGHTESKPSYASLPGNSLEI